MIEKNDIIEFVKGILGVSYTEYIPRIANVYLRMRNEVQHFTLRNLSRALNYIK